MSLTSIHMELQRSFNKVIVMLLILLIMVPKVMPKVIKHISVCQGEVVYFDYFSSSPISYAHFGKKKNGKMEPDPYCQRVDNKNNINKVNSDPSFCDQRLSYNGSAQDGNLLFILRNAQVNDSGIYRSYMKESGVTAMYTVDFYLTVTQKDNCTSNATETPYSTYEPPFNGSTNTDVPKPKQTPTSTQPNNPKSTNETQWKVWGPILAAILVVPVAWLLIYWITKLCSKKCREPGGSGDEEAPHGHELQPRVVENDTLCKDPIIKSKESSESERDDDVDHATMNNNLCEEARVPDGL